MKDTIVGIVSLISIVGGYLTFRAMTVTPSERPVLSVSDKSDAELAQIFAATLAEVHKQHADKARKVRTADITSHRHSGNLAAIETEISNNTDTIKKIDIALAGDVTVDGMFLLGSQPVAAADLLQGRERLSRANAELEQEAEIERAFRGGVGSAILTAVARNQAQVKNTEAIARAQRLGSIELAAANDLGEVSELLNFDIDPGKAELLGRIAKEVSARAKAKWRAAAGAINNGNTEKFSPALSAALAESKKFDDARTPCSAR